MRSSCRVWSPARADGTWLTTKRSGAAWSAPLRRRAVSSLSSIKRTVADMAMLLPECDHRVPESVDPGRLHEESPRTGRAGGGCVLLPVRLRQDEDRNGAQRFALPEPAEDGRRVHVGQVEIEDDEGRPRRVHERRPPFEERERAAAVLDRVDREPLFEDGARGAE